MKYRKLVMITIIGALSFGMVSGCASLRNMGVESALKGTKGAQDAEKVKAYEDRLTKVLDDVETKDDYKKIPLDSSEDASWFLKQSFTLWDKQQSKEQYISNGDKRFPGYTETFKYLADEFTK
jgi:hypothetical protein